ncbi:MAG TPA: HAD family phosphatase [Bryobacteraceae bacterium]|nr:HAD family phosphatase [Bryobacteraceae bacterium]
MPLIFDLDGVIVDSMPLHIESWGIYLQRLGTSAVDIAERMHGRRNDEIVREWIGPDLTDAQVTWHGAEKEKLYREMMRPVVRRQLVPGVEDFLQSYPAVKKAVASNAERPNIDLILDGSDLRHHFYVVLDGQQVQRPKPFPDIYLRAAELLGVGITDCVIFEDSPAGVAAGLAAGAQVVGVLTHPTELRGVDLLIRDFRDMNLRAWLESLWPDGGLR